MKNNPPEWRQPLVQKDWPFAVLKLYEEYGAHLFSAHGAEGAPEALARLYATLLSLHELCVLTEEALVPQSYNYAALSSLLKFIWACCDSAFKRGWAKDDKARKLLMRAHSEISSLREWCRDPAMRELGYDPFAAAPHRSDRRAAA